MKNILITGASSGIGKALALQYAKENSRLILIARNQQRLQAVAEHCLALGAMVETVVCDVAQHHQLIQIVGELDQNYPIDVVIANAGIINSVDVKLGREPFDQMKKVIDINLLGMMATIDPLIEPMQKRQKGQIVLIASMSALRGLKLLPAYSASKAAVMSYGESLYDLLHADNIQVTTAVPGFIESPLVQAFPGDTPFKLSSEQAAIKIIKAVNKGKARVSFPFLLGASVRFLGLIPLKSAHFLLKRLFY
jgi:short-subunit dehydrogenase